MTSTEFSKPDIETPAWVDLARYDQSDYDRGRSGVYVLLWWLVQAIAFPLSPHFANGFRCWLLRRFGATVGEGVIVRPTARFTYPWKVTMGDFCWVGDDVVFYSLDEIRLGNHCVVSQKSYLCTGSHEIGDRQFGLKTNPITLGNGVWVATDCFVAAGVTIGSNTVVGARSSVFSDLPAGFICLGSPCRAKSPRTMNEGDSPGS
ncbi:MAG: hormogonium polysaccharide biosynthesis acetyltransferase HpsU [Phormidium sp. BM_Day4_Bin.17]|nr:hormogonium polysaccharide biosynthesis acetyltransferase HpsU [Phormidium sp. BM_Day4_Bin.17]UCJ13653.1 MAG: hormogonium polysaccharide biosynthesis acetyltransferase HpsU [Phormidium sp. PBR-2020]